MTDGTALRPHRATLVLVLGIVGLVCCMPAGIVAWVLGHQDLKDMNSGLMDPAGRGMTQAGKILGMISVALAVLALIVWVCLLAFGVVVGSHANV
jgi:Domain of unknown function (DUF4190)